MAYKRYQGSTGRYEWVEEAPPPMPLRPPPAPPPAPPRPALWDNEDLLVLAVLWLMYRSGGGPEMLLAMAAYALMP